MENIEDSKQYDLLSIVNELPIPERIIDNNIKEIEEISGEKIADIQEKMRPGTGNKSSVGFIGNEESLIERLQKDQDEVKKLGLTDTIICAPLWLAYLNCEEGRDTFTLDGTQYTVEQKYSFGVQESPYKSQTSIQNCLDLKVTNTKTGKSTPFFSVFLLTSIPEIGFYEGVDDEGNDLPYRLSPQTIYEVFEMEKYKDKLKK